MWVATGCRSWVVRVISYRYVVCCNILKKVCQSLAYRWQDRMILRTMSVQGLLLLEVILQVKNEWWLMMLFLPSMSVTSLSTTWKEMSHAELDLLFLLANLTSGERQQTWSVTPRGDRPILVPESSWGEMSHCKEVTSTTWRAGLVLPSEHLQSESWVPKCDRIGQRLTLAPRWFYPLGWQLLDSFGWV